MLYIGLEKVIELADLNYQHLYLPLQESRVDIVMEISEREADETMRALAKIEGVFAGSLLIAKRFQDYFQHLSSHSLSFWIQREERIPETM